jgi:hypothetical protein
MNRYAVLFACFTCFLGVIVFAADVGAGPRYWGWLRNVPLGDKICHFGLMFTFTLLANLALSRRPLAAGSGILLGSVLVGSIVLVEEVSQLWIPGRSFDLVDLAADSLGLLCGDILGRRFPLPHGGRAVGGSVADRVLVEPSPPGNS